ncbi:MAG: hypothetical protein GY786_12195 [Proteobacteria bacterium]|nr:hypothetical protein [Pseudomonadota bacterium]
MKIRFQIIFFQLFFIFILLFNPLTLLADDDDDHDYRNGRDHVLEEISEGLGVVSMWGLVLFNGFYYYSMVFKSVPRSTKKSLPDFVKMPVKWKVKFKSYHYLGNPLMIGIAFLHGWWAEKSHPILWIGWAILPLLMTSGIIMKIQKADQVGAKVNRLIHTQHLLSITMILCLLIGHAFVD